MSKSTFATEVSSSITCPLDFLKDSVPTTRKKLLTVKVKSPDVWICLPSTPSKSSETVPEPVSTNVGELLKSITVASDPVLMDTVRLVPGRIISSPRPTKAAVTADAFNTVQLPEPLSSKKRPTPKSTSVKVSPMASGFVSGPFKPTKAVKPLPPMRNKSVLTELASERVTDGELLSREKVPVAWKKSATLTEASTVKAPKPK